MERTVKTVGPVRQRLGLVRFRNGGCSCSFNYTTHLEHLITIWCERYPQLQHIDMDRVIIAAAKCRSRRSRGVYANIISLRFARSRSSRERLVRLCRPVKLTKNAQETFYVIRFFLPRFHDLPLDQKVTTILHELYHVHPKCNGEFRDFGGHNWAHGRSRAGFDAMFESLRRDIMKNTDSLCELFLNCNFNGLQRRFGDVYGSRHAAALKSRVVA